MDYKATLSRSMLLHIMWSKLTMKGSKERFSKSQALVSCEPICSPSDGLWKFWSRSNLSGPPDWCTAAWPSVWNRPRCRVSKRKGGKFRRSSKAGCSFRHCCHPYRACEPCKCSCISVSLRHLASVCDPSSILIPPLSATPRACHWGSRSWCQVPRHAYGHDIHKSSSQAEISPTPLAFLLWSWNVSGHLRRGNSHAHCVIKRWLIHE